MSFPSNGNAIEHSRSACRKHIYQYHVLTMGIPILYLDLLEFSQVRIQLLNIFLPQKAHFSTLTVGLSSQQFEMASQSSAQSSTSEWSELFLP